MRAVRIALLALLLAVSGCTVQIAGEGRPSAKDVQEFMAAKQPLYALHVFEDFHTIDFCSLLDTDGLAGKVDTEVSEPMPDVRRCVADIPGRSDLRMRVAVGPLEHREDESSGAYGKPRIRDLPYLLDVVDGFAEDGICVKYLEFPEGYTLEISAYNPSTESDAQLDEMCRVVDITLDLAFDRLVEKQHRHYAKFDRRSLMRRKLCDLLPAPSVARAAGLGREISVEPSRDQHLCSWTGRKSDAEVLVLLNLDGPRGQERITAGGREGTLETFELSHKTNGCAAWTRLGPFPEVSGKHEHLAVKVISEKPPAVNCSAARELAARLWPTLPR